MSEPPAEPEPRLEAWTRRTDLPLTVLSLLYLGAYAVQVLATRPGQPAWHTLEVLMWALWGVFVVDYVVRLALAHQRLRFVLRHPVDLLVVLAPFFRFLRLLRLVSAIRTLGRSLQDSVRGQVGIYLAVSVTLLSFVGALAEFEAERDAPGSTIHTFGDALWWVATTVTTVGYGDVAPVTAEGRFVAVGLMLAGIGVLGTVTAAIASWFVEQVRTPRSRGGEPGRAGPNGAGPNGPGPDGTGPDGTAPATAGDVAALRAELAALRALVAAPEDR